LSNFWCRRSLIPEAVFVTTGKFDKSVAYLLKWLIKRESYSTGLKHSVTTKMNEYKNFERNFEYSPTNLY
jgi:hypothetical protein